VSASGLARRVHPDGRSAPASARRDGVLQPVCVTPSMHAAVARNNVGMASSAVDRAPSRAPRARYRSLRQRLIAANAVLLVAACLVTVLIVAPGKFSSLEVDETILVLVALAAVTLVNVGVVHSFLAPLQALTALARRVDPGNPGQRVPDARPTSEAGELAVTFNDMLARLELERSQATRRVLAAHESERLRIAQELHDEVGQTLTAVLLQLSRLEERLPDDLRGELSEAQEAARASLEDVRRIATDLRPEALKDLGLASALAALSDGFGRRAGLRVEHRIQTPMPRLNDETELVVYRVAQEALTNVARHARSHAASLTVESDADRLRLVVRDHGRGLPKRHAEGNGIRGMRERAGLIGADLEIETPADGDGTELRFELPLTGALCSA
jgi:two-component system, NarL family, sensor histidine kinase UhpB